MSSSKPLLQQRFLLVLLRFERADLPLGRLHLTHRSQARRTPRRQRPYRDARDPARARARPRPRRRSSSCPTAASIPCPRTRGPSARPTRTSLTSASRPTVARSCAIVPVDPTPPAAAFASEGISWLAGNTTSPRNHLAYYLPTGGLTSLELETGFITATVPAPSTFLLPLREGTVLALDSFTRIDGFARPQAVRLKPPR